MKKDDLYVVAVITTFALVALGGLVFEAFKLIALVKYVLS
jgi:hypothetical protein